MISLELLLKIYNHFLLFKIMASELILNGQQYPTLSLVGVCVHALGRKTLTSNSIKNVHKTQPWFGK